MRGRNHASVRWLIIAIAGSALEADALRNSRYDATLSHATRATFQTDTKLGKAAFTLAWTSFFLWFLQHTLKGRQWQ